MMALDDVIDCVTWLVRNLQSKDRFFNMPAINQPLRTSSINFFCIKETYLQKSQGLIMSLNWEIKKLF